jgi:hypothetical protein
MRFATSESMESMDTPSPASSPQSDRPTPAGSPPSVRPTPAGSPPSVRPTPAGSPPSDRPTPSSPTPDSDVPPAAVQPSRPGDDDADADVNGAKNAEENEGGAARSSHAPKAQPDPPNVTTPVAGNPSQAAVPNEPSESDEPSE